MAEQDDVMMFGPRQVDTYVVALRSLLAFSGAFAGSAILFLIYLFFGMEVFRAGTGAFSLLFFLVGSIIITMATNLAASWLQMLADREKFAQIRVWQIQRVFAINMVIFVLFAVFYFYAFLFRPDMMTLFFVAQLVLSALFSVWVLDSLAGFKYALQSVMGTILGSFLAVILVALLWQASFVIFLLLGLPVLWFSLAFGNVILESLAYQIYILYGVDMFAVAVPTMGVEDASEDDKIAGEQEEEKQEGGSLSTLEE